MNKDIAGRLSREYSNLWDDSMSAIPDGWVAPLINMIDKLYVLSDVERSYAQGEGLATWVALRIEVSPVVAIAYATPLNPAGKWNPARALACIEALSEFHGLTQETCMTCGAEGHLRMRILGGHHEGVYCDEHNPGGSDDA
ncbi:hypothetical protein Kim5_CH02886 [Rhizobium sp. Kim5]|uniref:hypothetical protein n=1 Tax=Rhizobium sp. Kim5 TaxID=2020311 RepID=UPI00019070FA|nr:hypothetical protein [Rhizobium sp. Kim5]ARQ58929.1 hypothetical protein Kim5_CH02886 [Rhizobium sp. Kim5]